MGLLTVNQVARETGVPAHTVRYYTRIGLLRPGRRRDNGYKQFTAREVQRLNFIRRAQKLGFSLGEIEEIVSLANRGETPCPRVREILAQRLLQTRANLDELAALVHRIETALEQWAAMKDGVPDGDAVCTLIEAFSEL